MILFFLNSWAHIFSIYHGPSHYFTAIRYLSKSFHEFCLCLFPFPLFLIACFSFVLALLYHNWPFHFHKSTSSYSNKSQFHKKDAPHSLSSPSPPLHHHIKATLPFHSSLSSYQKTSNIHDYLFILLSFSIPSNYTIFMKNDLFHIYHHFPCILRDSSSHLEELQSPNLSSNPHPFQFFSIMISRAYYEFFLFIH